RDTTYGRKVSTPYKNRTLRALCKSNRFDRVWKDLVPRFNRQGDWAPTSPANDNRAICIALAA
ncbi:MAG: hypothetical protein OXC62_10515, partial [Aestuariivita sp.]|nr:hypothetical protein [Aestuariivita sp.]